VPGANPNGSLADIAGISNGARERIGMMPHPERLSEAWSRRGRARLFESIVEAVE